METPRNPELEMTHEETVKVLTQLQERQLAHYSLSEEKWKNFEEKWTSFEDNSKHFFEKVLEHETHIVELNKWQSYLNGMWKAALVICTVVGFIVGILIQMNQ